MNKLCLSCFYTYDDSAAACPHCGAPGGIPANEAYQLPAGTRLKNRFIIGRVLGSGGFGVTYLAYDEMLRIRCAVKEYLPGEFCTRVPGVARVTIYSGENHEQFMSGKEKFLEESQKLAQFRSEQEIVHVFDCFEENDTAYIVMEYLDGESLRDKLERVGKIPPQEALPILRSILTGLIKVHRAGMLHRDVAPDNIFLMQNGDIKLFDFGAARFATTKRSRSLTVQVKSGFTPIEQYQSRGNQGPWTDVYASAATFYKMVTGETPQDSMERAAHNKLVPLYKKVKIDRNVSNAVMNALNIDPVQRTPSAEQFLAELNSDKVKRKEEKLRQADIGKMSMLSKALILGGLLLAAGAVLFAVRANFERLLPHNNVTQEVMMPDLIGLDPQESEKMLKDMGLRLQVTDKEYSTEIMKNKIIDQSVKAATPVAKDETVTVTLSAGIEQTYVPDFIGAEGETAKADLLDFGLVPTWSEKESYFAPGAVISQSREPYEVLDSGSEIAMVTSKGYSDTSASGTAVVDNFVGLTLEEAGALAQEKHLYIVRKVELPNDTVPDGVITAQEPAEGSELAAYSTVKLTVSSGRERVLVPDVTLITQDEAAAKLADLGLQVRFEDGFSDVYEAGMVMSQEQAENSMLEVGTEIVLTVSRGSEAEYQRQVQESEAARRRQQNNNTGGGNTGGGNTGGGNTGGGNTGGGNTGGGAAAPAPVQAPSPTQAPAPPPQTAAPSNGGFDSLVDFYSGG